MSVQALAEVRPAINEDLVAMLREALEEAESGEMTSAVVVGMCRGNALFSTSGFHDGIMLLGALHHALHAVSAAMRRET